ncbi:MAG: adenylate cyclase regulatory domain-containing protein [Solirubrobacteraceae bacterium]|nr:adenylate cyclase regulatory domain-containing protein [Solirubrobacteraceae bacterium]
MRRSVDRKAEDPLDEVEGPARETRYSAREIAAQAGVDVGLVVDAHAALGLARVDPQARCLGEADLALARRLRAALDAGLPAERVIDVNRVIGRAMAQVATAARLLDGDASAGRPPAPQAERMTTAVQALAPSLEHALSLHLRELGRSDTLDAAALASGAPVSVGFADLVGLGWLGGELPADELGRVARRLEDLAGSALQPPVRMVKTVCDAVMLVSPGPAALVRSLLELVEAAGAEDEGFPRLRAGVASGDARELNGDVYGRAVTIAGRLTAIARPGSVLVDAATHDAVGRDLAWSFAGERRIKGLPGGHKLFRARRPPPARPAG